MTKKSTHQKKPSVLAGVPENVTHVPRLTIKKLADQLIKIEKDFGYETALLGVERLDYVEICQLTQEKGKDNDPHLMPSRFMLLYGATDKGLKDKGHLDKFPHELNKGAKEILSIERLAWYLGVLGFYDGPWRYTEDQENEDGEEIEIVPPTLEGDLFGALSAYINQAPEPVANEIKGGAHTVTKGQSLSDIAAIHGIRDWRLLWELNKGTLGDNWDVIKEGASLKLPDTTKDPMVDWIKEHQWDEYLADKGYQYPGKYLSLTILDAKGEVRKFPEPARCQVYRYWPTPLLLHDIELEAGDDLDVLVPDTEHLGLWIDGVAIGFNGRRWPSYDEFLKEPADAPQMAGLAAGPRQELPVRMIEVDKDDEEADSFALPDLNDLKSRADDAKSAVSGAASKVSSFKLP
ncbi:MAG TPA: LysM domain-containing protein [Fibrobacteria bacterium]|nr:LysM domain-containing protein [Fibrobacteria bacterium]